MMEKCYNQAGWSFILGRPFKIFISFSFKELSRDSNKNAKISVGTETARPLDERIETEAILYCSCRSLVPLNNFVSLRLLWLLKIHVFIINCEVKFRLNIKIQTWLLSIICHEQYLKWKPTFCFLFFLIYQHSWYCNPPPWISLIYSLKKSSHLILGTVYILEIF